MSSSSFVVLLGLLFVAETAVAQSEGSASVPGARRIELTPDDVQSAPEIAVSSGLSTALFFDSDLMRDSVELEGRDRFTLMDVGQATIRLVPSSRVTPGERFRLVVRFRDGAAPVSAFFLLRVHPAKAESVIEVYRGRRTIETYQQEAREAHAELVRCQIENARLLVEHDAPGGLAGLISTGGMDEHGVTGRVVTQDISQSAGSDLRASYVTTYRSTTGVAVDIQLTVKAGARPWIAKGTTLKGKAGVELTVLRVWQQRPIPAGEIGRVVIEAEASATTRGPFTLKLWEEDGPRTVTLGNVTFP
ncbi:DUF2381 family protein [Corallococcus praedator]|uniref:DUF2381 family protein n=1 Tax=Corallococcus praedator TaxID=2316724 RepID=A0ABX9QSG0_9BACT|nr:MULTISPECIES: DUF2381 family protein [Corallococcus]RKH34911.1 DUF2381 family protein [Corallococcus sp. CA031C]RKI17111.1 DUF2381 family protein [Corallococcus praedator]